MQEFLWENVRKSVRNYIEVTENILGYVKKKKKKKSKNQKMSNFSPHVNFNCPYLKIGLSNLFPVLLECITYISPICKKIFI